MSTTKKKPCDYGIFHSHRVSSNVGIPMDFMDCGLMDYLTDFVTDMIHMPPSSYTSRNCPILLPHSIHHWASRSPIMSLQCHLICPSLRAIKYTVSTFCTRQLSTCQVMSRRPIISSSCRNKWMSSSRNSFQRVKNWKLFHRRGSGSARKRRLRPYKSVGRTICGIKMQHTT